MLSVSLSDKETEVVEATKLVADARVRVEPLDLLHLVVGELEVEDFDVLTDVGQRATPRDRDCASSHSPIEHHLGLGLTVFRADGVEGRVVPKGSVLDLSEAAHRSISNCCHVLSLHETEQLCLRQGWVQFNLIDNRLVASVAEQVGKELQVEVGHADSFDEACVHKRLKLGPELMDGHSVGWVRVKVASWPVNKQAVNIIDLQLGHRGSQRNLRVLKVAHPHFCHHEHIFPADSSFSKNASERLAHDFFVIINCCTVEEAVPTLRYSIIYGLLVLFWVL